MEFNISFKNNRTVSIDEMSNKIKYSFNNCYQIFVYNITAFTYLLKFQFLKIFFVEFFNFGIFKLFHYDEVLFCVFLAHPSRSLK